MEPDRLHRAMGTPRSADLRPGGATRRGDELSPKARAILDSVASGRASPGLIDAGLEQIVRRGADIDATARMVVGAYLEGAGANGG